MRTGLYLYQASQMHAGKPCKIERHSWDEVRWRWSSGTTSMLYNIPTKKLAEAIAAALNRAQQDGIDASDWEPRDGPDPRTPLGL